MTGTSLIARREPTIYIFGMRETFRRLLFVLFAAALVGGSAMGLAAPPAMAGEPCAHEHGATPASDHHHGIDSQGCLACCIGGICLAVDGVPTRPVAASVKLPELLVSYWTVTSSFTGHSLAPDPMPPRSRI